MALPRGNHYAVLGVDPDASADQIERAYRHLMELYSEDALATYTLLSPEEVRQACAQVRQAYGMLRDPVRRLEYDARHGFITRPGMALDDSESSSESPPDTPGPAGADASTEGQKAAKEGPAVLPEPVTGAALRRFREERGISLREVSDVSKVGLRYLEYIENDRHAALPAPVYIRGFVQEYSRVVGLDPRRTAEAYLAQVATSSSEA